MATRSTPISSLNIKFSFLILKKTKYNLLKSFRLRSTDLEYERLTKKAPVSSPQLQISLPLETTSHKVNSQLHQVLFRHCLQFSQLPC
jgi:hypothetical protein